MTSCRCFLADVPDKTAASKLDITPGTDEKFAIVCGHDHLGLRNPVPVAERRKLQMLIGRHWISRLE